MNLLVDPSRRPVIGHRGNSAHAPENTIESYAQAVAAGADAIELDVRLSADGVPVVFHDPHVSRTTDGTGVVAQMTFEQLRSLDAGARFTTDEGKTYPYRGIGHRIPAFDEVLEAFPSTPIIIEIKTAAASEATRRVIESRHAEDRVLVDSMSADALEPFADSPIPLGAARPDVVRLMTEVLLHRPLTPFAFKALCVPLSYYGLPLPVLRFARVAPEQGCVVHVWTVNDTSVATKLWRAGVVGIITDDPAAMLRARALLPR